jgi:uncharacterized membrane protein
MSEPKVEASTIVFGLVLFIGGLGEIMLHSLLPRWVSLTILGGLAVYAALFYLVRHRRRASSGVPSSAEDDSER